MTQRGPNRPCLGCGRTPRHGAEFQLIRPSKGRPYRASRCRDCLSTARKAARKPPNGPPGSGGDWARPCVCCGLTPADGATFGTYRQETKHRWTLYRGSRCAECAASGRARPPKPPKAPKDWLGPRSRRRAEKAGGAAWTRVLQLDQARKNLAGGRSVSDWARLWLACAGRASRAWTRLDRYQLRRLTRPRAGEWDT